MMHKKSRTGRRMATGMALTSLVLAPACTNVEAGGNPAGNRAVQAAAPAVAPAPPGGGAPRSVTVMTWNVCGDSAPKTKEKGNKKPRCSVGQQPGKVAEAVRSRLRYNGDGTAQALYGKPVAVLLEEVCYQDVERLRSLSGMGDWKFRFTAIKDRGHAKQPSSTIQTRYCGKNQGKFGIAVGVRATSVHWTVHYYSKKYVPDARASGGAWNVHSVALCGDALDTRFCGTHLNPFLGLYGQQKNLPTVHQAEEFLTSQHGQAKEFAALGKGYRRVVLGGDLNSAPNRTGTVKAKNKNGKTVTKTYFSGTMLDPLYHSYKECEQSKAGGARPGRKTYETKDGTLSGKLDYLFTNTSAKNRCYVPDGWVEQSDHKPVTIKVTF